MDLNPEKYTEYEKALMLSDYELGLVCKKNSTVFKYCRDPKFMQRRDLLKTYIVGNQKGGIDDDHFPAAEYSDAELKNEFIQGVREVDEKYQPTLEQQIFKCNATKNPRSKNIVCTGSLGYPGSAAEKILRRENRDVKFIGYETGRGDLAYDLTNAKLKF